MNPVAAPLTLRQRMRPDPAGPPLADMTLRQLESERLEALSAKLKIENQLGKGNDEVTARHACGTSLPYEEWRTFNEWRNRARQALRHYTVRLQATNDEINRRRPDGLAVEAGLHQADASNPIALLRALLILAKRLVQEREWKIDVSDQALLDACGNYLRPRGCASTHEEQTG